jgi:hypothetical protein
MNKELTAKFDLTDAGESLLNRSGHGSLDAAFRTLLAFKNNRCCEPLTLGPHKTYPHVIDTETAVG